MDNRLPAKALRQRNYLGFHIVNSPFLPGNIPSEPSYDAYIFPPDRFCRVLLGQIKMLCNLSYLEMMFELANIQLIVSSTAASPSLSHSLNYVTVSDGFCRGLFLRWHYLPLVLINSYLFACGSCWVKDRLLFALCSLK